MLNKAKKVIEYSNPKQDLRLNETNLREGDYLGEGQSKVYKASYQGTSYAVKKIEKGGMLVEMVGRELEIMYRL